jgi:hypothetical protein
MFPLTYSQMFGRRYARSIDLRQNPVLVAELLEKGFIWVRPVHRPWALALRNPTVGHLLELSVYPQTESVRLDSARGARLYRTLCARS